MRFIRPAVALALSTACVASAAPPATRPSAAARAPATRPAVRTAPAMAELNFDSIALADCLSYLQTVSGVNMVVDWAAIEAAGVDKTTAVTLKLRRPTLRLALNKTLDAAAPGVLAHYVEANILTVTTKAVADARHVVRVYPVGDLLADVQDFQGPELSLQNSSSGGGRSGGGGGGGGGNTQLFGGSGNSTNAPTNRSPAARAEQLVDLIHSTVRPDVWDVNGGTATIRVQGNTLIIKAPLAVHEAIGGR